MLNTFNKAQSDTMMFKKPIHILFRLYTSPRILLIIMTSQHLYPLRTVWRKPSMRNLLNPERKYLS
jgi:hypothetical protein